MYSELTKQQWMQNLGLREDQLPQALIVLGTLGIRDSLSIFSEVTESATSVPGLETVLLASSRGIKVAFAAAYGAPMAADLCHVFCALGVHDVVQLGWYGGLQPDLKHRELLVPQKVSGREGVSARYWRAKHPLEPDPDLRRAILDRCSELTAPHRTGRLLSTTNITAETRRGVLSWSWQGFTGVDLETAATFAVAKKFKKRFAALLSMSDLVVKGQTIWEAPNDPSLTMADDIRRQLQIALTALGRPR